MSAARADRALREVFRIVAEGGVPPVPLIHAANTLTRAEWDAKRDEARREFVRGRAEDARRMRDEMAAFERGYL